MKGRPKRADAQLNRERVLDAALAVFGEHGVDGSTELIASRAGVGVATVFRHFTTKQALLEATLERMITQLADSIDALAETKHAGDAFFGALDLVVERAGTKKAVVEGLGGSGEEIRSRVWSRRLRGVLEVLLERAQKDGTVRDDIGVDEVTGVLIAAARAVEKTQDVALRARVLRVIFDGLRASARAR